MRRGLAAVLLWGLVGTAQAADADTVAGMYGFHQQGCGCHPDLENEQAGR